MRHLFLVALIAGLGFSFPLRTLAQQSTPDQIDPFVALNRQRQREDPAEITFSIRLKDNRTRFQQGEIIQLELIFSSSIASRFSVNRASYDRSGRLNIDDFVIDRERSTVDPLSDYFNSLFISMAGGLTGFHELDDKSFALTTEINEWLRFDEPGHYRLYVESKRVGRKRSPEYLPQGNPPLSVVSNIIEFEIVPADAKWARRKLAEASAGFGQSKNDQERRAGCRTLRFLGTQEAVSEMVKLLGTGEHGCDHEFSFGLIGSPHRALAISEMERSLAAPNHPVNSTFLRTLAILVFATQEPKLPPYPVGNEAAVKNWQALNAARREKFAQILERYIGDLVNAIPSKHDDARAVSLQTLLTYQQNVKQDGTLAKDMQDLLGMIPDLFLRLPLDSQTHLLRSYWKSIAKPAMLPVLQRIYEGSKQQKEPDSYQQRELRTIALTRLYELAPEEGRRLILAEISRLERRVNFTSLGLLPDETLPELDETLATHLEQTKETGKGDLDAISGLIERYATVTILPRVQAFFAPQVGRSACRTQSALLAYILRVDPPTGADLIAKALAARGKGYSRCYPSTLTEVAALHMAPEIEAAAIEALEESDPEMVVQAASVLSKYGSARVEKILWERFERWISEVRDRAGEFMNLYPGIPTQRAPGVSSEVMIEQALLEALSKGQAWLADREKLERLRALCLTQNGLDELNSTIRGLNLAISIGITPFNDKPYMIGVAQYNLDSIDALKKKLLQFPAGTIFKFGSERNSRSQQLFQELKSYLEAHGLGLEEP